MAKSKNKQKSTLPVFLAAIGIGLVAALLAGLYLKSREAAIRAALEGEEVTEVRVVVANKNLPRGTVIEPQHFSGRLIPEKFVHEDAVLPGEFERYIGRSIVAPVGFGKPLLKSFMDDTFPVDFSDTIPKGRRAITVTVDEVNSVAGFIRPGNHIDLFVNIPFNVSGFKAELVAQGYDDLLPSGVEDLIPKQILDAVANIDPEVLSQSAPTDVIMPVLQNVRVLAAGRSPYRESLDLLRQPQEMRERTFTNVTLDVTPREAALLTTALDKGELLALLRNRNDEGAADFSTVAPRDLFTHASDMANEEQQRRARAIVAGGLDEAGNLVDANGNRIMSRSELEKAGYRVNEKGQIIDKDGNVVDPTDIIIGADGKIVDRAALAAAGLTVNENGQIVDKDGRVVAATDLVRGPDGKMYTRDQLEAAGLSVNANGEIVDANGKVVTAGDMITGADGKLYTRDQLAAAGLSVNANGEIVDAHGNVVSPDALVTTADGKVLTRDQLAAAGLSVDANGNIVDKDGRALSANEVLARTASADALAAAGLKRNANGDIVDEFGNVLSADQVADRLGGAEGVIGGSIRIIVGGASEDGVAKFGDMPIEE